MKKKTIVYAILTTLLLGVMVYATTTITDTGIDSGNATFSGNIDITGDIADLSLLDTGSDGGRTHIFFDNRDGSHRASIDVHNESDSSDPSNHFSIYVTNSSGDLNGGLNILWGIDSTNVSYRTNGGDFLGEFDMARNILRSPRLITNLGAGGSRLGVNTIAEGTGFYDETGERSWFFDDEANSKRRFTITSNNTIRIPANETGVICDAGREGEIYFDTDTNKHYGCDGSSWNALY